MYMSLFQRAHELSKLTSQLRNVAELITNVIKTKNVIL